MHLPPPAPEVTLDPAEPVEGRWSGLCLWVTLPSCSLLAVCTLGEIISQRYLCLLYYVTTALPK